EAPAAITNSDRTEATSGSSRSRWRQRSKSRCGGAGSAFAWRLMKSFATATARLKRKLGARVVRTDAASRHAASFDSSKILFSAAAVICPRKEADIGVVLELANKFRVPVTTRGRGTTLTGAAAPV